ncbi:MAG TPA: hypothetical protein PKZ78_00535 [Candidatus Goldiibacteriota bacterium]|nr:hypothetical protein [Candidatus Goldiibacteriota bacterium]
MSTLYSKIQSRHTTGLNTQIKDFLPIIGSEIPNKLITYFDVDDTALISSTAGDFDYIKAYHGKSCYKSIADTDTQTITYTPATPLDLTILSDAEANNYATITRPANATDAKDKLHLVLQWRCKATNSGDVPTFSIQVKNGTKTATLTTAFTVTNAMEDVWWKTIFAMDDTKFTYANGFADADWANITEIVISHSVDANPCDFYVHGLWIALPYEQPGYGGDTITGAYYPSVPGGHTIYVSHLFGDDANTGLTKKVPKKTIESGLAAAITVGYDYVCIIDSATYKPIDTANNTVGLNATLTADVTIIADYLETPTISAEAGLFDATRTGARDYYRTAFYENIGGTKTKHTVGAGGTYATIALAYAAASAGDCIEIVDSAVYDETLDIAKDITIQAAPTQKPTWKYTSGNNTVTSTGDYAINIFGIIFEGNFTGAEERILISNTTPTKNTRIIDCTFVNIYVMSVPTSGGAMHVKGICHVENNRAVNIANDRGYIVEAYGASFFINNIMGETESVPNLGFLNFSAQANIAITCIGNYASTQDKTGSIYYISTYNATSAKAYVFFNTIDTGCWLVSPSSANTCEMIFSGNEVSGSLRPDGTGIYDLNSNLFSSASVIVYADSSGTFNFEKNICDNDFNIALEYTALTKIIKNNLFVNCTTGTISGDNGTLTSNVFYNCTINPATGITLVLINSLYYNVTIGGNGTVSFVTSNDLDPLLLNPEDGNYAWEITSPIEDIAYIAKEWREFLPSLISFTGATYTGNFKFITFTGAPNFNLTKSGTASSAFKYCDISGFCQGVRASGSLVKVENCTLSDIDGVAIMNYATSAALISVIKNNIITDSYVGIFLRSSADVQYNTITRCDYGLYSLSYGFFSIEEYAKEYTTIKNNILFNNNSWDYSSPKLSDYNIIGSREYPDSAGDNDISENPQLDSNYYPATVYTGYKRNSPAYLGASDANKHIGARNEQHIAATLTYTAFTFVDNPINFTQELEPVNAQTTMSVTGVYEGIVDAFVAAFNMEWTEDTITDSAQKQAIELIKKTTWILGLSFDAGSTWGYYKVEIDGILSTRQPVYLIQEVPYGSYSIRVREIPGFLITDYEVDAL